MKKNTTDIACAIVAILLAFFLGLLVGVAIGSGEFIFGEPKCGGPELSNPDIFNNHSELDISPDGAMYVNDMIVVMTNTDVEASEMIKLAEKYDAILASSINKIGFWQLKFSDNLEYEELVEILDEVRNESVVNNAYISTAFSLEDNGVIIHETSGDN